MSWNQLTPREREIMRWVRRGETTPDIASLLKPKVSPRTVEQHLAHIFEKLGVRTRTAALYALSRAGQPSRILDDPKVILQAVLRTEVQPALPGGHGARPFLALHLACGHTATRGRADPVRKRVHCYACMNLPWPERTHKARVLVPESAAQRAARNALLRRFNAERARLFADCRARGLAPKFNATTADLRRMLDA